MKNIRILVAAALTTIAIAAQATTYSGSIAANTFLYAGDYVTSANGTFTLAMQSDGNLVIYQIASNGAMTPKWATGAVGSGARAVLQTDGNFVVYRADNTAAWSSVTGGRAISASYRLALQDTGELDIYAPSNATPIWSVNVPICGSNPGPYVQYPACYFGGKIPTYVFAHCVAEAAQLAYNKGAYYGPCVP